MGVVVKNSTGAEETMKRKFVTNSTRGGVTMVKAVVLAIIAPFVTRQVILQMHAIRKKAVTIRKRRSAESK